MDQTREIVSNVEKAFKGFIDQFLDIVENFKTMIEELVEKLQNLNSK